MFRRWGRPDFGHYAPFGHGLGRSEQMSGAWLFKRLGCDVQTLWLAHSRSRWPRTIRIRQDASVTTAKPAIAVARDQVVDRVADQPRDRVEDPVSTASAEARAQPTSFFAEVSHPWCTVACRGVHTCFLFSPDMPTWYRPL